MCKADSDSLDPGVAQWLFIRYIKNSDHVHLPLRGLNICEFATEVICEFSKVILLIPR